MDIKVVAQHFYDYSLHIRGYSKETIRRYRYVITLYYQHSHISTIEEVSLDNVRSLFFHGRTERKWSANTAIVFHKSLLVFFRWCITEGYLSENPILKVEKPRLEQKLPKKLTKQDTMFLLEMVRNYPYKDPFLRFRNHALFAMFVFAGLRKSELLHLRFADVDLKNMTLFISQGKGCKDRLVPIHPQLAEILQQYVRERSRKQRTCLEFFTSSTSNRGFTDDGLKHLVRRVQDVIGWKFTVHKLRHTFATLLLEGGCDIYCLSKIMGHTDIKTTTIYLSASAEHLREQIAKHSLKKKSLS